LGVGGKAGDGSVFGLETGDGLLGEGFGEVGLDEEEEDERFFWSSAKEVGLGFGLVGKMEAVGSLAVVDERSGGCEEAGVAGLKADGVVILDVKALLGGTIGLA
jgi:hypothetical protein